MHIPFNASSQTPAAALQLLFAKCTEQQHLSMLSNHPRKEMIHSASKILKEMYESDDVAVKFGCQVHR